MGTAIGLLIVITVSAVGLFFGIRWLVQSSSRYRGSRTVTCPETKRPAIVAVDSLHASLTSTVGAPDIRLEACSRWPMKEDCGQECLTNLDLAPESCLIGGVLMRWYRDKSCVYCQKVFSQVHWLDHRPAFLTPERKLLSWKEVDLENLPNALETYLPVCWDCYIAQRFRLNHPELVVLRQWPNDDRSSLSHRR